MEKTNEKYSAYIHILEEELVPAMGCTEPIAIAYGAAKGREALGALPDEVVVEASGNIIKNVKSVVVPNTGGLHGIEAAAAAGVVAGRPDLLLEVISQVTPEQQEEMRAYLKEHPVRVEFLDGNLVFDVRLTLRKGRDTVKVRIANYHTNIVYLEHNGEVLLDLSSSTGLPFSMDLFSSMAPLFSMNLLFPMQKSEFSFRPPLLLSTKK